MSAPPRVGLVVEEYCSFIGNEIRALRRVGAELELLAAFRPLPEPDPADEELRKQARYFPASLGGVLAGVAAALVRTPFALAAVVARMLREGAGLRMAALACCFARLVRERRIAHLHAIYSTRTATLAWGVARLTGVGYSFSAHANDMWRNPSIPWKARDAVFVRTISAFNRAFLVGAYAVSEDRVAVCRLGADTSRGPRRPGGAGAPRVLSVGRLAGSKGHLFLLEACARLRDAGVPFSCRIVGSGPQEDALRRRIRQLDLEALVTLEGWLTHAETLERFAEADVFVLACTDERNSSAAMDGIPVALMEAMAASLPVVSTSVSGIPELVDDGRSGLLVPERSADALCAALGRLLQDPELRRRLGEAGRARVSEDFDLLRNAELLRAWLEWAARGAAGPAPGPLE